MTVTNYDPLGDGPYNQPTIRVLDNLLATDDYDASVDSANTISNEGALLLLDYVLKDLTPHTLQLFEATDPSFIFFCLTKAIAIYAIGDKKHLPPPHYFSCETIVQIKVLREEISIDTAKQILETLKSFTDFNSQNYDNSLHIYFKKFLDLSYKERSGTLIMKSWSIAAKVLDEKENYSKEDLIRDSEKKSSCTLL